MAKSSSLPVSSLKSHHQEARRVARRGRKLGEWLLACVPKRLEPFFNDESTVRASMLVHWIVDPTSGPQPNDKKLVLTFVLPADLGPWAEQCRIRSADDLVEAFEELSRDEHWGELVTIFVEVTDCRESVRAPHDFLVKVTVAPR